jgi:hypothetical protein
LAVRRRAPAKERHRPRDRRLIGLAERAERRERVLGIFALAQLECVEAARFQVVQVVARDMADRAQLALVVKALAQQPRYREAAPVLELREIDGDDREAADVAGDGLRRFVAVQPDAEPAGPVEELAAPLEPERERHDDVAAIGKRRDAAVRGPLKPLPAVLCDAARLDEACHRPAP